MFISPHPMMMFKMRLNLHHLAAMVLSFLIAMGGSLSAQASSTLASSGQSGPIILQSTTSTQNSGLYDHILPLYQAQTGGQVRVVAVGTGQAIKNAKNCDGDVLLVHSKADEMQFVADGYGLKRVDVMYNDFVMVGPKDDPAQIKTATSISTVLGQIYQSKSRFISRGDDSGTHKAERRLWQQAKIDPSTFSGRWYLETGQGMGGTLNIAVQLNGYVIADRSTWMAFGNREDHEILFQGDQHLFNQYGVIVVNPAHCPSVQYEQAQAFADWLTSPQGQAAISSYRINGQQLFFGNAPKKG